MNFGEANVNLIMTLPQSTTMYQFNTLSRAYVYGINQTFDYVEQSQNPHALEDSLGNPYARFIIKVGPGDDFKAAATRLDNYIRLVVGEPGAGRTISWGHYPEAYKDPEDSSRIVLKTSVLAYPRQLP